MFFPFSQAKVSGVFMDSHGQVLALQYEGVYQASKLSSLHLLGQSSSFKVSLQHTSFHNRIPDKHHVLLYSVRCSVYKWVPDRRSFLLSVRPHIRPLWTPWRLNP